MTADPRLLLVWLVVAHLVADFVLQTDGIVRDKSGHGWRAVRGLGSHAIGVAVCLAPVIVALGAPGLLAAAVVVVTHVVIDRAKILLTRRAELQALALAHRRHETARGPVLGMDAAWTPLPAALFAFDQLAHLLVLVVVWAALLAPAPLTSAWLDALAAMIGQWSPADVHRAATIAAVGLALVIVNVRAASLFVAVLVNPRGTVPPAPRGGPADRLDEPSEGDQQPTADARRSARSAPAGPAWRVRLGPFELAAADVSGPAPTGPGAAAARLAEHAPEASTIAPPARIGEAIGVLERLLVVVLVLSAAEAGIGFVIAAKTLARFRQLDDRAFAEYYLLGTLASVLVALVSGLLAVAALGP